MPSSPATNEQLEEQLEELTFLAEAIAEQVNLIDAFQTEHVLPHQGSGPADGESSQSISEKFEALYNQFEENLQHRSELAQLESELARREERLNGQRKSLAQRFKAEWAKLQLEKLELDSLKQLVGEPAETTPVEPEGVSLVEVEEKLNDLSSLLQESDDENRRLNNENKELRKQLAEVVQHGESEDQSANLAEIFELKRKLELTLEELQEAKSENYRIKSNPSSAVSSGATWEETKEALLASLENESQMESCLEDPAALVESLREAHAIIQQKEQTIQQLELLLEESNSVENHSGSENTPEDPQHEQKQKLIDESAVIAEEKNRLNALEEQWRQKIGEAEIELSKERAKLARERAALDEKLKSLEEDESEEGAAVSQSKRKWWDRLGLG